MVYWICHTILFLLLIILSTKKSRQNDDIFSLICLFAMTPLLWIAVVYNVILRWIGVEHWTTEEGEEVIRRIKK